MNNSQTLIKGAHIVLPDRVVHGDLLIVGRKIERIIPKKERRVLEENIRIIDAGGMYLLPGMIDLHSDAIEKEIEPRPKTHFPIRSSLYELEKKLAASGITTIYHSISMGGETGLGVRNNKTVVEIIKNINRSSRERFMIRHRVHLRYEVTNLPGLAIVRDLLKQRMIHLLSFMDHTPGQGQYTVPGSYEEYMMKARGFTEEEARSMVEKLKSWQKQVDVQVLKETANFARQQRISVASHDDDTPAKIDKILDFGVTISEFPINLNTALYARSRGIHVAVGAPNVVRGSSHANNLRAIDAIRAGAADIICSDYYPPAMLAAVFKLVEEGIRLPEAVCLVSLNPARAVGLEQQYGSIEVGKQADLVFVELYQGYPFIRKTMVGGRLIYQAEYQGEDIGGELVC